MFDNIVRCTPKPSGDCSALCAFTFSRSQFLSEVWSSSAIVRKEGKNRHTPAAAVCRLTYFIYFRGGKSLAGGGLRKSTFPLPWVNVLLNPRNILMNECSCSCLLYPPSTFLTSFEECRNRTMNTAKRVHVRRTRVVGKPETSDVENPNPNGYAGLTQQK